MQKYITFEYDIGGWNNIRLALENVIIFAILLKRTLVLPPTMHLYLLNSENLIHFGHLNYIDKNLENKNHFLLNSQQK